MKGGGKVISSRLRAAALFVGLLAFAVMMPVLLGRIGSGAYVAGFRPLVVLGGSMEPTIKRGSIVITRRVSPGGIRAGDVITFKTPASDAPDPEFTNTLTTHRVTEVVYADGELGFHTKGDANEPEDTWFIPSRAVVGRTVMTIPYLGRLSAVPKTPSGYVVLILIPGLTVIAFEIRRLVAERSRLDPVEEAEAGQP